MPKFYIRHMTDFIIGQGFKQLNQMKLVMLSPPLDIFCPSNALQGTSIQSFVNH